MYHLFATGLATIANKHRPKKNRPPYRRVVGTAEKTIAQPLHDSEFEKIDTLAAALDALIIRPTNEIDEIGEDAKSQETLVATADSVFLPPEIVDTIFTLLEDPITLDLLLVCKTWYRCGLPFLYKSP